MKTLKSGIAFCFVFCIIVSSVVTSFAAGFGGSRDPSDGVIYVSETSYKTYASRWVTFGGASLYTLSNYNTFYSYYSTLYNDNWPCSIVPITYNDNTYYCIVATDNVAYRTDNGGGGTRGLSGKYFATSSGLIYAYYGSLPSTTPGTGDNYNDQNTTADYSDIIAAIKTVVNRLDAAFWYSNGVNKISEIEYNIRYLVSYFDLLIDWQSAIVDRLDIQRNIFYAISNTLDTLTGSVDSVYWSIEELYTTLNYNGKNQVKRIADGVEKYGEGLNSALYGAHNFVTDDGVYYTETGASDLTPVSRTLTADSLSDTEFVIQGMDASYNDGLVGRYVLAGSVIFYIESISYEGYGLQGISRVEYAVEFMQGGEYRTVDELLIPVTAVNGSTITCTACGLSYGTDDGNISVPMACPENPLLSVVADRLNTTNGIAQEISNKLDNLTFTVDSVTVAPTDLSRIECLLHSGHAWEYTPSTISVPIYETRTATFTVNNFSKQSLSCTLSDTSFAWMGSHFYDDSGDRIEISSCVPGFGRLLCSSAPTVTIGNTYTAENLVEVGSTSTTDHVYTCSVCGLAAVGTETTPPAGLGIYDMAFSLKSIDGKLDNLSISATPTDLTTVETTLSNILDKMDGLQGSVDNLDITVTPDSPVYDVFYIDDGDDTTEDESLVDVTGDVLQVGGKLLGVLYRVVFVDAMDSIETSLGDFESYYTTVGTNGGASVWD